MKAIYLFLSVFLLPLSNAISAYTPKEAKPKLEKSICFGCQLTQEQNNHLKELVKQYNQALSKYCSWIWVAQRQNFIHRPPKEALHQSRKHIQQLETAIDNLMYFYLAAGIPAKEIEELKTNLTQRQNELTCELATLSVQ